MLLHELSEQPSFWRKLEALEAYRCAYSLFLVLCGREPCGRDAEGRAGHVVEPQAVAEVDAARFAARFAADADFQVRILLLDSRNIFRVSSNGVFISPFIDRYRVRMVLRFDEDIIRDDEVNRPASRGDRIQ